MTDLTLVMAFYCNMGMLTHHYDYWSTLPVWMKQHIRVVIVDDGSPERPARPPTFDLGFPLTILRMVRDVPWNQDACRNLGVAHADTDWLLLTDMDHQVPEATFEFLINAGLDRKRVYRFSRVNAPRYEAYKLHPNSYFMTKETYETVGGYDERFAGYYGTDGGFLRACEAVAGRLIQLDQVLIRYPREVIPDASTTRYARKRPSDKEEIDRIRKKIAQLPPEERRPQRGLFEWERVYPPA